MMLNAFVLSQKDCELILSSLETWSIQDVNTKKRGVFALSCKGQNLIYGKAELIDVIPLTKTLYKKNAQLHKHEESWEEITQRIKHPYAWIFKNSERFSVPILSNSPTSLSGSWIRDAIDDDSLQEQEKSAQCVKVSKPVTKTAGKTLAAAAVESRRNGMTYGEYSVKEQCQTIMSVHDKIQMAKNSGQFMTIRERMRLKELEDEQKATTHNLEL